MTASRRNISQFQEHEIMRHPVRAYNGNGYFTHWELKSLLHFLETSNSSHVIYSISYDFRYKQFLDVVFGDCDDREPEYEIDYKILLNRAMEIIQQRHTPQDQLVIVPPISTDSVDRPLDRRILVRQVERREVRFDVTRLFTLGLGSGFLYSGHSLPREDLHHDIRLDSGSFMMMPLEVELGISLVTPYYPQRPLVFDYFDDTQPDPINTFLNIFGIPAHIDNEGNIRLREGFSFNNYFLRSIGSYLLHTLYDRLDESAQSLVAVSLVLLDAYNICSFIYSLSQREIPREILREDDTQSIATRISNTLHGFFSRHSQQANDITPPQLRR